MTNPDCKAAREQLALMLYGELSFDEEERVEAHLDTCAECRAALARQKELHEALDAAAVTPSPELLARSRAELTESLDRAALEGKTSHRWWSEAVAGLHLRWAHPLLQPLGAVALLTMGFFGARLTSWPEQASLANLGNAHVRNVAAEGDGRVRIVVDEPRERTVEGRLDDEKIRALLTAAARNATDASVRERTIAILVNGAPETEDSDEIRDALVFALVNDEDGQVRAKAMEGLKPYAGELEVQQALAQSMLHEADANLRVRAIQMLTDQQARDLNRQVVGSLQELMIREGDRRVRERVQHALQAVNASSETY